MKRIIFDTSVYGNLVMEDAVRKRIEEMAKTKEYIIYGNSIIRKELRQTPKTLILKKRNLRILLLTLYDSFVKKENHDLKINILIETLSKDYFKEYKKNNGVFSDNELKDDLMIIATATIYHLDIVVSNDERTMLSKQLVKVYESVNREYGMKNPLFKNYLKFKKELSL